MRLISPNASFLTIVLSALLFTLTACGGSSNGGGDNNGNGPGNTNTQYTGSESPATVNETNQEDIATASQVSTVELINQSEGEDVPLLPSGVSLQSSTSLVKDLTQELIEAGQLPTATTNSFEGPCGGTAAMETSDSESGWIEYNNYCSGDVVINGRVVYSVTDDLFVYEYQNMTVTHNGTTQTLNMEMRCDTSGGAFDCTYSSSFAGDDGRTYRASGSQVSGNSSSGYNVSARVYDEDHGYVEIEATNIILCAGGGISSGSISVTDTTGGEVMTIDFSSCDSMTVTYNGVSEVYSQ